MRDSNDNGWRAHRPHIEGRGGCPLSGELTGRGVVITGAAGGIGAALARRFGREGAHLALLDLEHGRLQPVASELEAAGISALALACDVTSAQACGNAIATAVENFGGIDVLLNNAGITHLSLFRDTDLDVIRRVMEVNFFGAVHCTQAALPHLLERRGHIAVLSSFAGLAPLASRSGYAASKHALNGFFGSLRTELRGAGVGVTLVCPTFIKTNIGDRALGGDGRKASLPRSETGTPASPERLAEAIYVAVRARRPLLVPFRDAKIAWWVSRLAPALFERMMFRRIMPSEPNSDAK